MFSKLTASATRSMSRALAVSWSQRWGSAAFGAADDEIRVVRVITSVTSWQQTGANRCVGDCVIGVLAFWFFDYRNFLGSMPVMLSISESVKLTSLNSAKVKLDLARLALLKSVFFRLAIRRFVLVNMAPINEVGIAKRRKSIVKHEVSEQSAHRALGAISKVQ